MENNSENSNNIPRKPRFLELVLSLIVITTISLFVLSACHVNINITNTGDIPTDTKTMDQSEINNKVESLLSDMSIEEKIAQLFFVYPESITGVETTIQAGDATKDALTRYPVGGICYFSKNLLDSNQTKEMLSNTQKFAKETNNGIPIFLAVDEEGGDVSRIGGAEGFNIDNVGDMSQIGQTGNPKNAYDVGIEIGTYLKELGFNVDFAPVADVVDDNENNVMLSRSFGSAPTAVGKFVKSEIEGILSTGVLCCAKHFPGIGTAEGGDSHENTILSYKSESDMMSTDIVPFISAIQANVPFIMVGHLTTPAITGNELPASLNSTIMVDILRNQLGYQGVIITDSLEMAAVEDVFSPYEIGVKVLEAGADMILMPSDFDTTYQGVVDAVNNGTLSENRIDDSVKRILTAKLSAGL